MAGDVRRKAAQYLRMSTEHQRYSLDNQAAAIAHYADRRGFEIGRTYLDSGISGLTLKERQGLQALLADALRPDRDFDAVLVLDVSRWGRFQDPDQAAHYEFLCREAGVQIVYCAEAFENDDSTAAKVMKHLKRVMAAEYSRELSAKCSRAHHQQARLGLFQGGAAPYGFRRTIIGREGETRLVLQRGQRKAMTADRVILTHGPPEELAVIRRIYRLYVRDKMSAEQISAQLNREGCRAGKGQPWNHGLVLRVLRNELVIGIYVYNRLCVRMKTPQRPNPPEAWIRAQILEPIIPPAMFRRAAAQRKARAPKPRLAAADMLQGLQRLLEERGKLTRRSIDRCSYVPWSVIYQKVFGSMQEAYRLAGYDPRVSKPSDEALLTALRESYARQGGVTLRGGLNDPSLPSASTYTSRFGTTLRAYELAGLPHSRSEIARAARLRLLAGGWKDPRKYSRETLIAHLRRLYERDGNVSGLTMRREPSGPKERSYASRFGSLVEAYAAAGLPAALVQRRADNNLRRWTLARRGQRTIAGPPSIPTTNSSDQGDQIHHKDR